MKLQLKSLIVVICLLLLWLTPVLPIQSASSQTEPAWTGQIAYVGADGNLWLLRSDRPEPLQLSSDASEQRSYTSPVFSPKGDMLAYCARETGEDPYRIYLMRSGSWQPILIADDVYCSGWPLGSFSWSPDGRQIAYARTFEYAPQSNGSQWSKYHGIWVADVTDGSTGELVPPPGNNPLILPQWSPDGKWMRMYESVYLEGLGVMRTWDSQSGALYNWLDIGSDIYPGFSDWSPDSSRLVFDEVSYIGYPGAGMFTATPGGADMKTIYDNGGNGAVQPHWSPDGQKLAFLIRVYGNDEQSILATSSPDGSNLLWVFSSPAELGLFGWSPDSQQILFTSTETNESGSKTSLFIYDLASASTIRVVGPIGGLADWAPIPPIEKSGIGEGSSQIEDFQTQGSALAYLAGNYQLMLFDPASGDQAELSPPLAAVQFWASPSGNHLVYGNQLLSLNFQPDGKLSVKQTELPGTPSGERITWAPGENRLAFQDAEGRVYMVDVTGDFIEIPGASDLPGWSSDQVYLSYCTSGDHLWVIGGGTSLQEIASPVDCQVHWSPTQPLLAYTVKGSSSKIDQVFVYDAEKGTSTAFQFGVEIVGWSPDGELLALRQREPGSGEKYTYTAVDPRSGKSLEVGTIDLKEPGLQTWGETEKDYLLGPYQFTKKLNRSEPVAQTLFDAGQGGKTLLTGQANNGLEDVTCTEASTKESRTLLSANLSGMPASKKPGLWSWLSPDSSWTSAYSYDPAGYRYLLTRCDRTRQVSLETSADIGGDSFSPDSAWYMQVLPAGEEQAQLLLYNLASLDRQSLPVLSASPVVWVQTPEISAGGENSVSGKVSAANGSPVTGATVLIDGEPAATTDEDGAFSISGIAEGAHVLSVQAEGLKFDPEQVGFEVPTNGGEIAFAAQPVEPPGNGDQPAVTTAAGDEEAVKTEAPAPPAAPPAAAPVILPILGPLDTTSIAIIVLLALGIFALVLLVIRIISRSRRGKGTQAGRAETQAAEEMAGAIPTGAESKSGPRSELDDLLRAGVADVKAGNNAAGLEKLSRVVEKDPDLAVAWLWSGMAEARLKDRKRAEQCFQRAKKLGHPKADEALRWLNGEMKK